MIYVPPLYIIRSFTRIWPELTCSLRLDSELDTWRSMPDRGVAMERTVAVIIGLENNPAVLDEGDERDRVEDEAERAQYVIGQRRNCVAAAVRLVEH